MALDDATAPGWDRTRAHLLASIKGWLDPHEQGSLTLPMGDEDWLLEVSANATLVCMAGYDLEDMRSILCDGTTEDLGSDELAKQAKFYLQQTISKHRQRLLSEGFTERIEMNEDYVAAHFSRPIDVSNPMEVERDIHTCQRWLTGTATNP